LRRESEHGNAKETDERLQFHGDRKVDSICAILFPMANFFPFTFDLGRIRPYWLLRFMVLRLEGGLIHRCVACIV
jgi:hypothetical protein